MRRLFLLAVALLLAGCGIGAYVLVNASASSPPRKGKTIFALMKGPRVGVSLRIDEQRGTVGLVRLGMSLAAAEQRLPGGDRWPYHPGPFDAVYCSTFSGSTCVSPTLYLAAPEIDPSLRAGVSKIYLEAGLTTNGGVTDRTDIVTDRGVRFGSSLAEVQRKYKLVAVGPACYTTPPGRGATYYARAGSNSIAFEVRRGIVQWITLIRSPNGRVCETP